MSEEEKETIEEQEEESQMPQSVVQANAAAARLEKANARLESNLSRLEKAQIERVLGGKTAAGNDQPQEETPQEYAAKVMGGEIDPKD